MVYKFKEVLTDNFCYVVCKDAFLAREAIRKEFKHKMIMVDSRMVAELETPLIIMNQDFKF